MLVFVEEVYSSIQSLKILNPNSRDFIVQNTDITLDDNKNNSNDLDIENNPSMELTIRSLEDVRDIHDEDGVIEEKEARNYGGQQTKVKGQHLTSLRPDIGDRSIFDLSSTRRC